jgi:hypothetical protein
VNVVETVVVKKWAGGAVLAIVVTVVVVIRIWVSSVVVFGVNLVLMNRLVEVELFVVVTNFIFVWIGLRREYKE